MPAYGLTCVSPVSVPVLLAMKDYLSPASKNGLVYYSSSYKIWPHLHSFWFRDVLHLESSSCIWVIVCWVTSTRFQMFPRSIWTQASPSSPKTPRQPEAEGSQGYCKCFKHISETDCTENRGSKWLLAVSTLAMQNLTADTTFKDS